MKIHYQQAWSDSQDLLCVTHTDRVLDPERASLNFLELRFARNSQRRAADAFESLPPASHAPNAALRGDVTIWDFVEGDFGKPRLLAHFRPEDYKPQYAAWHNGRLWVLGTDVLEVFDSSLTRLARISDPWMSDAHTIAPDGQGRMIVSCSTSDCVLVIDERTCEVVQALRMPESLYGFNYPLKRTDSVVEHYIPKDRRLAHLNGAWAWRGGILVSALLQGVIGWFDATGDYRELLRGFVGIHGVRVDPRSDRIYFSDTCTGVVVFLTADYGVEYRVATDSRWLHDAQHLSGAVFALSVGDHNRIDIMDFASRKVLASAPCRDFGNGTIFVYYGK